MADRLHNKKRPREENEENQLQQQEDSSAITCFHPLRLRELGKIRKLPHIYRDYHVRTFGSGSVNMGSISFLVSAVDIIFVVHSRSHMVLFRRQGDEISPVLWDNNRSLRSAGHIKYACYNSHDNSFLFLMECEPSEQERRGWHNAQILTLEIASIEAGIRPKCWRVFPGESSIMKWALDIPICRAMIHNDKDRKYKFFELKDYNILFTIPDLRVCLKNLSPGNMDMVMYEEIPSSETGSLGIPLRIYSKLNGELQKEIFLPQPSPEKTEFVALCGSDTLLMQQYELEMEVVEICCENPVSIKRKNTKIRAACEPYYLHKRSQFICYTKSGTIIVCNLQGEILVALVDHPLEDCPAFENSRLSSSQEIFISLCRLAPSGERWIYTVNISSLVTGERLEEFSSEDPNCSDIRKGVLNPAVRAFEYDERTHQIFMGNDKGVCGVWSNKFHNDAGDVRNLMLRSLMLIKVGCH